MKLLLVEDDKALGSSLVKALSKHFSVEWADTGSGGLMKILNTAFDAIILDVNLPDISGIQVCQKIRSSGDTTPIIILSGLFTDSADIVTGLNDGADDYLVKPFDVDELLARLRALVRRNATVLENETITIGDLVIDMTARAVTYNGNPINLRRKEYDLLEYLARNSNRVLTRQMILDHVWDSEASGFNNTVDVHIKYLRDKVDRLGPTKMIRTVHGLGYKMEVK